MYCFVGLFAHRFNHSDHRLRCYLISKVGFAPASFFVMFFPISAADPFLRGWEGGISGRDGVSTTASSGAGANPNCEAKSGVRDTNLIAKVIVWVTAKVTKSTINLAVRLDVTFNVMN